MRRKILLIMIMLIPTLLPAQSTAVRVRCGTTTSYTDSAGNSWTSDAGDFNAGSQTYSVTRAISGTKDSALFQTERWDTPHLTYSFAMASGTYQVTVNLAEIYFASAGQRVMSIAVQGTPTFSNIDIFKEVGSNAADVKTTTVTLATAGTLTIDMTASVNNPKCSSISVVQTILPTPPPAGVTLTIVTNPATGKASSLLLDDGTAVYTGAINVTQRNGSTDVPIGTINSDSNGNLTGSVTVNPSYVDTNGNITLALSLAIPGVTNSFSMTIPVSEVQQPNETGIGINVVLVKTAFLQLKAVYKSFSLSLAP